MRYLKQPELINEWGTRFYGKACTDNGNTWWYEEKLSNGTIKKHPLIPITPGVIPRCRQLVCVNGHDRCYLGPDPKCPYCEHR